MEWNGYEKFSGSVPTQPPI